MPILQEHTRIPLENSGQIAALSEAGELLAVHGISTRVRCLASLEDTVVRVPFDLRELGWSGRKLIAASRESIWSLEYDVEGAQWVEVFRGAEGEVRFSNDGSAALWLAESILQHIDLATSITTELNLGSSAGAPEDFAISGDGKVTAVRSRNRVRVFRPGRKRASAMLEVSELSLHRGLFVNLDGTIVSASGRDSQSRLQVVTWDVVTRQAHLVAGVVKGFVGRRGHLAIWCAEDRCIKTLRPIDHHELRTFLAGGRFSTVRFSLSGDHAVITSGDEPLWVEGPGQQPLTPQIQLRSTIQDFLAVGECTLVLDQDANAVQMTTGLAARAAASFSGHGAGMAAGPDDQVLFFGRGGVLAAERVTLKTRWQTITGRNTLGVVSLDSGCVAAMARDGLQLQLLDGGTGDILSAGALPWPCWAGFQLEHQVMVAGDRGLVLVDPAEMKVVERRKFADHESFLDASDDGQRMLVRATDGGDVRLVESLSNRVVAVLPGQHAGVVAFADNDHIVTAAVSDEAPMNHGRIWDAHTGEPVQEIVWPERIVWFRSCGEVLMALFRLKHPLFAREFGLLSFSLPSADAGPRLDADPRPGTEPRPGIPTTSDPGPASKQALLDDVVEQIDIDPAGRRVAVLGRRLQVVDLESRDTLCWPSPEEGVRDIRLTADGVITLSASCVRRHTPDGETEVITDVPADGLVALSANAKWVVGVQKLPTAMGFRTGEPASCIARCLGILGDTVLSARFGSEVKALGVSGDGQTIAVSTGTDFRVLRQDQSRARWFRHEKLLVTSLVVSDDGAYVAASGRLPDSFAVAPVQCFVWEVQTRQLKQIIADAQPLGFIGAGDAARLCVRHVGRLDPQFVFLFRPGDSTPVDEVSVLGIRTLRGSSDGQTVILLRMPQRRATVLHLSA